jgi:hypothetical protein
MRYPVADWSSQRECLSAIPWTARNPSNPTSADYPNGVRDHAKTVDTQPYHTYLNLLCHNLIQAFPADLTTPWRYRTWGVCAETCCRTGLFVLRSETIE